MDTRGAPGRAASNAGAVSEAGVGDLGELYAMLARRLEQIVRLDVRAPEPVIEEACQFAWSRLTYHRDRVRRDAALTWLAKTAIHEAFKLIRRDARELSLEATLESGAEMPSRGGASAPDVLVEQRERLASVHRLPERQQRLVWLHALGHSYAEMAAHEGYTPRTVERQLLRARESLRVANA
ncbi:MAG: sigma-70 family RNA polymerase sigma factor [Actinomycetota bacterium]|nr:sigma-70 family RNA polymerase sigma factor [Actinomycetota bacterium]